MLLKGRKKGKRRLNGDTSPLRGNWLSRKTSFNSILMPQQTESSTRSRDRGLEAIALGIYGRSEWWEYSHYVKIEELWFLKGIRKLDSWRSYIFRFTFVDKIRGICIKYAKRMQTSRNLKIKGEYCEFWEWNSFRKILVINVKAFVMFIVVS